MSDRLLNVYHLPPEIDAPKLTGSAAIVIDVLRATSTICQALASGAKEVVPFVEVNEAREAAAAAAEQGVKVVLGGERAGGRISGFDLGNSPSEYTADAVRRRRVIITTTNGTRALHHARFARRILVGAFVNLSAVVASVKGEHRVDILCAGTDGGVTREDILAAGAMVARLVSRTGATFELNAAAIAARQEWDDVVARADATGRSSSQQLAIELRETSGGRNLLGIGLDGDLVDCAQIDRLNIAPELNAAEWRIIVPSGKNR